MDFKTTKGEAETIAKIARRAAGITDADDYASPLEVAMDITATHSSGCPLDLDRLLTFPTSDFIRGSRHAADRRTLRRTLRQKEGQRMTIANVKTGEAK